jgi:hypothetical protein
VTLVSRAFGTADTTGSSGDSFFNALSADGERIVFSSNATNIAQTDTNASGDLFLFDAAANGGAGGVTLISRAFGTTGTTGSGGGSFFNALSADGERVVFGSNVTSIAQTDTNASQDLFLFDAAANGGVGGVMLISRAFGTTGTTGSSGDSFFNALSADGERVVFQSNATNIAQTDTNASLDLFLFDTAANGGAGGVTLVSRAFGTVDTAGSGGGSIFNAISADDERIVFQSDATNIAQTDTNGAKDLFLFDATANGGAGGVTLISRAFGTTDTTANGESFYAGMSANGRYIALFSSASDLVANGDSGGQALYVYDTIADTMRLVSEAKGGQVATVGGIFHVLDDGTVYFESRAGNIAEQDNNATGNDLFRWDLDTVVTGQTLTGSTGQDYLLGNAARDTLISGGGEHDTLIGQGGDDVIVISGGSFDRVAGDSGSDRLELAGAGLSLDLTTIPSAAITGIEEIDIRGSGNNHLVLSTQDVLDLSDESDQLLVLGNTGDTADIGSGWTAASSGGTNGDGTSTVEGELYQIYTAGAAALLVDTDVAVSAGA